MGRKRKIYHIIFIFVATVMFCVNMAAAAQAKTKPVYYLSTLDQTKGNAKEGMPGVRKMKFTNNSVTIYASFKKSDKPMDSIEEGKWCNYRKWKFPLSQDIKYFGTGGNGPKTVYTEKEFRDICSLYNGLGLIIKMKHKKAISMTVAS